MVSADSAVDLSSPSPVTSNTDIRGFIVAQADAKIDRIHLHDSRHLPREGITAKKTAKVDTKRPVFSVTAQDTDEGKVEAGVRRATRGPSKSKPKTRDKLPVKNDPPTSPTNIEFPPEPPKDAPNTVMLKVRLSDGECFQRRFNYQTSRLRDVVQCAMSVMDSSLKEVNEKQLTIRTNSVPKAVFSDLSLTLEEAGLTHNTLLHLDCEE